MRPELFGDLAAFRIIAAEGSFTKAARRLGVTQSALSQLQKRLEETLGIRLLARTTRSVAPTEAGMRLLAKLAPALDDVASEIEMLASRGGEPVGTVRLSSGKHAADTIIWPRLVPLMRRHPGVEVEVCVDDRHVDIVADRFDAGVRMGGRLEGDMVAVPLGPALRVAVVAAPGYLERRGVPAVPSDVARHRCIGFRTPRGELAPWDFVKDGRAVTANTGRGPVFNDGGLLVSAAVAGFGLLYVLEDLVRAELARGDLARVLEDWCEPFAGYHLYYPSRRQQTAAFRLVVDAMRRPPSPAVPGAGCAT